MDANGSPLVAGAAARLGSAPASEAYWREDLVDALQHLAAQRDALRAAIEEARSRTADLAAATSAAGSLHGDLAETWLRAEREAADIRGAAQTRAGEILRDAEARAAAIVASSLTEPSLVQPW